MKRHGEHEGKGERRERNENERKGQRKRRRRRMKEKKKKRSEKMNEGKSSHLDTGNGLKNDLNPLSGKGLLQLYQLIITN